MVAAAAVVPRLWNLGHHPLWHDEAMEVLAASCKCFPDRVLFYLVNLSFNEVVRVLVARGTSDAGLRLFPALMSWACVPLVMAVARQSRADHRETLIAGFLTAIAPLQIYYAGELRPYAVVTALALASHLLLGIAREKPGRAALAGWIAVSAFGAFTQGFPVFLAIQLAGVWRDIALSSPGEPNARRRLVATAIAGTALLVLSFVATAAYAVVFRNHLMRIESYSGIPGHTVAAWYLGFLFGEPYLGVLGAAAALSGMIAAIRQHRHTVALWTVVGFAASVMVFRYVATTKFSIRFWAPIQPFLFVFAATALSAMSRRSRAHATAIGIVLAFWTAANVHGIVRIQARPAKDVAAFDTRRDAAWLRSESDGIAGYLLPDLYVVSLLRAFRFDQDDRPVYLSTVYPDYAAILFGDITSAPCPPPRPTTGGSWVVFEQPVPFHREDVPFTNDLTPWWTVQPEEWSPGGAPRLVTHEELATIWFADPGHGAGERRIVRWIDAPAGRRTCFVVEAWRKARWNFLKYVPGYGLDVTSMTGPPVDTARCSDSGAP